MISLDLSAVLDQTNVSKTMLTEYFVANGIYPEARETTYADFPGKFTWNAKNKEWKPRSRGFSIGRLYNVSIFAGEKYYLRSLLNVVKGAQSFEQLKTVNGTLYPTFKTAAYALGLFENDDECQQSLQEASTYQTGRQLRFLFGMILVYVEPAEPYSLWQFNETFLSDDCASILQRRGIEVPSPEEIRSLSLSLLDKELHSHGKSLQDYNLPLPTIQWSDNPSNLLIAEETSYSINNLQENMQR